MDFLGNEIEPGAIVLYTGNKSSGFSFSVVKKVGKNRVGLTSNYPSRKDNDNIVIVTEEQLINSINASWEQRCPDGIHIKQNFLGYQNEAGHMQRHYDTDAGYTRPIREQEEIPADEMARRQYSKLIIESRNIKGEPLGEYGDGGEINEF